MVADLQRSDRTGSARSIRRTSSASASCRNRRACRRSTRSASSSAASRNWASSAAISIPIRPAAISTRRRSPTSGGIPFYEKMVELDVPAMIHVSGCCNPAMHTTGSYYLNADTMAFMQLILSDLFKDFPTLKLIIPHGGGAVPFHWGRFRGLALEQRPPRARRDHEEQHLLRHLRLSPAGHQSAHRSGAGRQHPVRLGDGRRGQGHRPEDRLQLRRHQALCRQGAEAERRRPAQDFRRQCAPGLQPPQDQSGEGDGASRASTRIGKASAKAHHAENPSSSGSVTARSRPLGLDQGFWTDLYHRSMTVYWPVFFGSAAVIFVALNAVFAGLYYLGDEPIANVGSNESAGAVLLLHRDAGDGRLWRHASADRLRASRRHRRNLHRHVFPRGDDRPGVRPLLAAARPLCVRQQAGHHRSRRASGP